MRSILPALLLVAAPAWAARPCLTPDVAATRPDKEICLQAHVYQLTTAPDGTRYLDICAPGSPDLSCRMTVLSLPTDRKEVGELDSYVGQDIHLRGTVHTLHGQSMMLLTHGRQFHDGPEKFRPNPALLAGFGADSGKEAVKDPALRAHRGSSSFKNGASF
jgi:hypothetical protein